jgi:hypothetical protein
MITTAQESIDAKQNCMYHRSLRRLPVEILLQIFEYCVEDEAQWCHDNPESIFEIRPTMALSLASVCSHWRDVMISTPHFWRHLRVPARGPLNGLDDNRFKIYLEHCRGRNVELSIPYGSSMPKYLDLTITTVQRLNLQSSGMADVNLAELPSPNYLFLYDPLGFFNHRRIPASLVACTSHLTVWNVGVSLRDINTSLRYLEFGGKPRTLDFLEILPRVPHLSDLDATKVQVSRRSTPTNSPNPFTHSNLRHLGLSSSGLPFVERSLMRASGYLIYLKWSSLV